MSAQSPKAGRPRRVTLEDHVEYEKTAQEERSRTLRAMTQEAASEGVYLDRPDTSKTR